MIVVVCNTNVCDGTEYWNGPADVIVSLQCLISFLPLSPQGWRGIIITVRAGGCQTCGTHNFQRSPHPWPWPWISKVKFWKSHISGMGWPIDMELKGCESIECWTHAVTFNDHLTHDLYLSRSTFEKVVSQEWDGRLTWNERDVSR